jgi:hypothetical protein
MADIVVTTIMEQGPQNAIVRCTNVSDGTGEAGVKKVDASATGPLGVSFKGQTFYPGIHLTIREVEYDVKAMGLRIQWDATTAQDALALGGFGKMKFEKFGGLIVPSGLTGATGSILFTTTGAMPNSSYSVILHLRKNCAFN